MYYLKKNELFEFWHIMSKKGSKRIFSFIPQGFSHYYRVSSADPYASQRFQPSFEDLLEELVCALDNNSEFVCLVYPYHATSLVLDESNWLQFNEGVDVVAIRCFKYELPDFDPNPDFVMPLDRSWWIGNLTDTNEVLFATNFAFETREFSSDQLVFEAVPKTD